MADGSPRKRPYEPELWITGDTEVTLEGDTYDSPQIILGKRDRAALQKGPYATNR